MMKRVDIQSRTVKTVKKNECNLMCKIIPVPSRYCPAGWIRLKVVSFYRSLLNGEAPENFSKALERIPVFYLRIMQPI
jgi:hypothetical protein